MVGRRLGRCPIGRFERNGLALESVPRSLPMGLRASHEFGVLAGAALARLGPQAPPVRKLAWTFIAWSSPTAASITASSVCAPRAQRSQGLCTSHLNRAGSSVFPPRPKTPASSPGLRPTRMLPTLLPSRSATCIVLRLGTTHLMNPLRQDEYIKHVTDLSGQPM